MVKKSLQEKLILKKIELDKKALREPRTLKDLKNKKDWERVRNILINRYNRWD
jgi:hypothetical protein